MQPEDLLSRLPPRWQADLREFRFEAVKYGMSGAPLFRLRRPSSDALFLKVAPPEGLADFRSEVERTRWLAGKGVRVPAILRVFDDGRQGVALMTALPGRHPHEASQSAADIVAHLARGLCRLHALAAGDCPFDETIAARLARARAMIAAGEIDGGGFAERNRGRSPQSLYAQLAAAAPQAEDIVIVHGDAKFDNLLIDGDGRLGFIDCGHCGRGDRYLDLEAVTSDIAEYFGPRWIDDFAAAYGKPKLDAAKLRFFSDLYELF